MNILIVEDIPAIAANTREALQLLEPGLDVDIAFNLHQAFEKLEAAANFDVVIVDLNLPDATGSDAPQSIREVCPDTVIVVLSGEESVAVAQDLLRFGIQDFIAKSEATPQRLLRTIQLAFARLDRESTLKRTAAIDALTGTLNRRGFVSALETSFASVHRLGGNAALCTIDIDWFKSINDRLGHPVGDAVLKEVASRLGRITRENDQIGRVGGDEFWVLLDDLQANAELDHAAAKLCHVLSQSCRVGEHIVPLSVSIGVAVAPADAATIDDWIQHSDEALYAAKQNGRGCWRMYADIQVPANCATTH